MRKGFTLLEVLLYITIFSIIIGSFVTFLIMVFETKVKNQAIRQVSHDGYFVINMINYNIRNAKDFNYPLKGNSSSSVSIQTYTTSTNPTIYYLESGYIYEKKGAASPVKLSSSRVVISNFLLNNISKGDPGVMTISFDVIHINPEGRNEYNYSNKFYGSASLR